MARSATLALAAPPDRKPRSKPRNKPRASGLPLRQRLALAVAGVATSLLFLSVWHCTESIAALTGSPLFLSLLLAIGIDAGMLVCEVSSVLVEGKHRSPAQVYIVVTVLLSAGLNGMANAAHAGPGPVAQGAAWVLGVAVPALVYTLARTAGHLWSE
jgi:hypothetical protein